MVNFNRYNRQILLPQMDIQKQIMLQNSKVLVIGLGGLGCPVLKTLSGAGVGYIGMVDYDIVSLSNLHRQILFDESDIGDFKTNAAHKKLIKYNSEIIFKIYNEQISIDNIFRIIEEFDIVVDCTDNFSSRYLINDVCYVLKKPLVYSAIFQNEGQLAVFNNFNNNPTNLRDIFPDQPREGEFQNCNEAGVMGVLTSIMGNFQANEVIKLIIHSTDLLSNKLLIFNSLDYTTHFIKFDTNDKIKKPTVEEIYKNNYFIKNCELNKDRIKDIAEFSYWINKYNALVIDVRNLDEKPRLKNIGIEFLEIPLNELDVKLNEIDLTNYNSLIFVCQSGKRSQKAIEITKLKVSNLKITDIQDGIGILLVNI
ncbi:MAG: ThiF family adenylyltransferase [Solirubrobacteraceae bacterium]